MAEDTNDNVAVRGASSFITFEDRLKRIETRQERIEELLEEIVDKLNDLSRDYGPGYAVEG